MKAENPIPIEQVRARWAEVGRPCIAGVDEAGRGPLAGPVVAAAVVLGPMPASGLKDSKQLTAARRDQLFFDIVQLAAAVSYAVVSPRKVDDINVLQATLQGMRSAVHALPYKPDVVHVDGNRPIPGLEISQKLLVGGDARCPAVAAASIVAKVVRDRVMNLWDKVYPSYGFREHKGYGTAAHVAALEAWGPCPLHRYSFKPVHARSLFPSASSTASAKRKYTAN